MTTKELSYLNDSLATEQTIIKKYQDYSTKVSDPQIANVLNELCSKHRDHYNKLIQQLNG